MEEVTKKCFKCVTYCGKSSNFDCYSGFSVLYFEELLLQN